MTPRFRLPAPKLFALDMLLVAVAWAVAFWLRFNFEIDDAHVDLGLQTALITVGIYGVLLLLVAARAGSRTLFEHSSRTTTARPILVIGTLQDATTALRALKDSSRWTPMGILSPLANEQGRSVQDIPVLGTVADLAEIAASTGVDTALVASRAGSAERRELLLQAPTEGLTLLTLPRPDEWLRAEVLAPRKIALEDLLGREPVQLDVEGLSDLISGQAVLVTGAGGSIGSELCRQIARFGVGKLVCVDVSEYAVYLLEQELRAAHPQMQGVYYTANVREADRLAALCRQHAPAVVFHAAAYKHVPLMEQHNEIEALRTNVVGTVNAARAAGACGARRFVMISTDKAVNPTNVMGASKRLAEMMVQAVAQEHPTTQYVSVRFGNVLGSSGSVVPLFTQQISQGGPVTVTHPDIVRYFMTIPEASQLVLQAGLMGRSGQIFVLDMGEPVKIIELARMLIRLSGKSEQDVPITFTGLRPGEKLYEELLADDETTQPTPHLKLRIANTAAALPPVAGVLAWVEQAGPAPSGEAMRNWLKELVPEYAARP